MSTYNYAPGALHFDIHNNNISVSASQIVDLVRSLVPVDVTAEPVTENPTTVTETPSAQRGPKTQFLFADEYGRENVKRSQEEAERVADYIADHHMGQMRLDSKRTNKLNLMVACFWYRWDEHKWVNSIPQGAAIYRFFTDYCKLPCDVQPRAFMNVICALINEGKKDPEIYDNLCGYFPQ